jgi:hypothetical protein
MERSHVGFHAAVVSQGLFDFNGDLRRTIGAGQGDSPPCPTPARPRSLMVRASSFMRSEPAEPTKLDRA